MQIIVIRVVLPHLFIRDRGRNGSKITGPFLHVLGINWFTSDALDWIFALLQQIFIHYLGLWLIRLISATLTKALELGIDSTQIFGTSSVLTLNKPNRWPTRLPLAWSVLVMDAGVVNVDGNILLALPIYLFPGGHPLPTLFLRPEVTNHAAWATNSLVLSAPHFNILIQACPADYVVAQQEYKLLVRFLLAFVAPELQPVQGVVPGK